MPNNYRNIIVLSDVHLAPRDASSSFTAEKELVEFLEWIGGDVPTPCKVMIAGDFFDFLVVTDGDGRRQAFDPSAAPSRARKIIEDYPDLFDALARFAAAPDLQLVILGGNHDTEFAIPEVRQEVEHRLYMGPRSAGIHWLVGGEAALFQIGPSRVLVEHGDLFDDWNRVDHPRLRRALNRISRGFSIENDDYRAPPGSELVMRFIEPIREQYPWLAWLKPEREAVIPILSHFLSSREKLRLFGMLDTWLRAQLNTLETFWVKGFRQPKNFVRATDGKLSKRQALLQWLEEERQLRRSRWKPTREELVERLRRVAAEDGYFDLRAPDHAAGYLPLYADGRADLVIHGHTHAAKAYTLNRNNLLYLNTGTWNQLLELPASDLSVEGWNEFLRKLEDSQAKSKTKLNFARLKSESRKGNFKATLEEWRSDPPTRTRRAAYHLLNTDRVWRLLDQ